MGVSPHSDRCFNSRISGSARRVLMGSPRPRKATRRDVTRRDFLKRAGWAGAGMTALVAGTGRGRAAAAASYPDWIPASAKPPKRGGVLTRGAPWDPPVIDPRLTQ